MVREAHEVEHGLVPHRVRHCFAGTLFGGTSAPRAEVCSKRLPRISTFCVIEGGKGGEGTEEGGREAGRGRRREGGKPGGDGEGENWTLSRMCSKNSHLAKKLTLAWVYFLLDSYSCRRMVLETAIQELVRQAGGAVEHVRQVPANG